MTRREELEREIISRARSWARAQATDEVLPVCRCAKCALVTACRELEEVLATEVAA